MADKKNFYTTIELAKNVGVTPATVIRWCNEGAIKHSRGPTKKGRIRIPIDEGEKIIKDYEGENVTV